MHAVSKGIKETIHFSYFALNQPLVKESVKNLACSVTFVFGLIEIYNIYQTFDVRKIFKKRHSSIPKWLQVTNKIIVVFAKISVILSTVVSRPSIYIISTFTKKIFSSKQVNSLFGPNTLFVVNPWHPRHVFSILSILFALPFVFQMTYKKGYGLYKNIYQIQLSHYQEINNCLIDSKISSLILFNTLTGRPTLHMTNQVSQILLSL